MQTFSQFLATKGADLSKTSAFLAFYALPYVPDPSSHPSFQDLFTNEWLNELRTRVEKFLKASVKPAKPSLFRAYDFLESKSKSKSRSDDDVKYIQTLEYEKEKQLKQCEKLQNEKTDLLAVATELVQALQQTADGNQISNDHLHHLFGLVSKFFPSTTIQKRPPPTPRGRSGDQRPLPTLDYTRIQKDLLNFSNNSELVARILQALRWRLSRTEVGDPRRRVFQTYISHDFLACMPSAPKNILSILLSSSAPVIVREYAARLVNCLSCECSGRAYLLNNRQTIQLLWDILITERADTILRQQALGALQKLSLRRVAQSKMIQIGAVDWILSVLGDIDSISKYTLEYGSALLLNLSLRISGRIACEKSKHDVLKVLSDLLECDNLQVRFYTNGTLYSVLARPLLRERAREMGMEDILKYLIKSSDENFANQIDYIMKQLAREDGDADDGGDSDDENDVEEDDDNDELVGDEEEAPEILPNDAQPIGESLLCSLYLAKTSEAQREDEEVRKSMDLRKLAHTPRGAQPQSYSPSPSPRGSSPSPRSSSPSPRSSSPSPSSSSSSSSSSTNNQTRAPRITSAPTNRTQPQQQVLQRPVTPGGFGNGFSSTMQSNHSEPQQQPAPRRPKTPGSLSEKEMGELQNAFGTRAKMARTPQAAPVVPLEPLPMIKPKPKKKS